MWGVEAKKMGVGCVERRSKRTRIRNSLLLAPMPTASTSQILGNNECFEPFTSAYIDQSQSLNVFMDSPNFGKLYIDAFLCMEERFEDRNVLFKN